MKELPLSVSRNISKTCSLNLFPLKQRMPASMLQVALVPPYTGVNNAVKPIPKSDGEARRYATEVI